MTEWVLRAGGVFVKMSIVARHSSTSENYIRCTCLVIKSKYSFRFWLALQRPSQIIVLAF